MIYFKKITKKMNKYIDDKNERKYKKIETIILINTTSSSVLKMIKITKKILFTKQPNKLFN